VNLRGRGSANRSDPKTRPSICILSGPLEGPKGRNGEGLRVAHSPSRATARSVNNFCAVVANSPVVACQNLASSCLELELQGRSDELPRRILSTEMSEPRTSASPEDIAAELQRLFPRWCKGRRLTPRPCRQCKRQRPGLDFPSAWAKECQECRQGPEKFCARCQQVKPRTDFTRSFDRYDQLFPWCRDCLRQARKASTPKPKTHSAEKSLKISLGLA
jgi:hypothetical protein